MSSDARFRALVLEAAELQAVDPAALSHKARQVFFVNLHNALWLHAKAWFGAPRSMLERKRITDLCAFNVGGLLYTPHAMAEGLLRAQLPEADARYRCVCRMAEGLQLLSLSDGTLSLPRHRVYVESSWAEDLRQNVGAWFATKGLRWPAFGCSRLTVHAGVLVCDTNSNHLQLPRVLKVRLGWGVVRGRECDGGRRRGWTRLAAPRTRWWPPSRTRCRARCAPLCRTSGRPRPT